MRFNTGTSTRWEFGIAIGMWVSVAGCASDPDGHLGPGETGPIVLNGVDDTRDQYRAALQLETQLTSGSGGNGCTATLISSGRVLTAGHCVCRSHRPVVGPYPVSQPVISVIDASDCVTTPRSLYLVGDGGARIPYSGRITPHPRYQALLDSGNSFLAVRADLAFIDLDNPIDPSIIRPLDLSRSPPDPAVGMGEQVTFVGFGDNMCPGDRVSFLDRLHNYIIPRTTFGTRRIGTNLLDGTGSAYSVGTNSPYSNEYFLIRRRDMSPNSLAYVGDSGGPLIATVRGAPKQIGVASGANCGQSSTFTNTTIPDYYDWITRTCDGCSVTFLSPASGTQFAPRGTMHLGIRTAGLPSFLRIVATKGGRELPVVPNSAAPPGSYSQDITIPEAWGTGDDYAICVTSDIPAWSQCLPFRITVVPTTCGDTTSNPANCGSCGNQCAAPSHARATCASSRCGFACDAGYGDCDHNAANGCEVNLNTDRANCNTCGHACSGTLACVAGSCASMSTCTAPLTTCSGVCVNPVTDLANCGSCGNRCSTPAHGRATCASSTCGVSCDTNFANCDGSAANGCEVDLRSDRNNCGSCGRPCTGSSSCVAGACTTPSTTCSPPTTSCAGACVNLSNDASNCGGCGVTCSTRANAGSTCASSSCQFACYSGFADCDGNASNGCEANLSSSSAHCGSCGHGCPTGSACSAGSCTPTSTCSGSFTRCPSGFCNNLDSDTRNCGSCDNVCPTPDHGSATCINRVCGFRCGSNFGDCNGSASDGCEAYLVNDANNCGACGARCATGQTCSDSRCMDVSSGCGAGLTYCAGVCRDTRTDNTNCGTCGIICTGTRTCQAGTCTEPTMTCGTGLTLCSGRCVSTLSDPLHCGACGADCTSGGTLNQTCSAGRCVPVAPSCVGAGQMYCDGVCVDTYNDAAHCGACRFACASGWSCTSGRCVPRASSIVVRCVPPSGWRVLDAAWGLSASWHPNDSTDSDPGAAFEFRTNVSQGDWLLVTFRMQDSLGRERWSYDFSNDPGGSGAVGRPQCETTVTRDGVAMPLHYVANGSAGSLPCNYANLLVPTSTASAPAFCW